MSFLSMRATDLKALVTIALALCVVLSSSAQVSAKEASVTRKEAFVQIWQSIQRPVEAVRKTSFADIDPSDHDAPILFYAKARGILEDDEQFFPHQKATKEDLLLWMFRTRNVEPIDAGGSSIQSAMVERKHLKDLAFLYDLSYDHPEQSSTREEMFSLLRMIDEKLRTQQHEVSLYSEKFHGKGGAFGEQFNMYDLTAAHRTFPHNTLVKVTNLRNGKSVTVRINDRGPYVKGRDMDLSLAAFLQVEDRSKGTIDATFERLGDSRLVSGCNDVRSQKRIGKAVILTTGVPHRLPLGKTLTLSSIQPFVVRDIVYPDGTRSGLQTWVTRGEDFVFTPSILGTYRFIIGAKDGHVREMQMEVVECGGGELRIKN